MHGTLSRRPNAILDLHRITRSLLFSLFVVILVIELFRLDLYLPPAVVSAVI